MKKVLTIFLLILIYILLFAAMVIGIYEIHNESTQYSLISQYTCAVNNIYIDEGSSADDAKMLNNFIETLPPVFVKEFRKDWKVIVEDQIPTPDNWPDYITIGGYTDWDSRIVIIRKQTDPYDMLDNFVHEIGHCFDFEYGSVSYSYLFSDFYELYKDNFDEQYVKALDGYSTSSPVEFFAACFKEYILCPDHLKDTAPKAYIFVDEFYKDVEKLKHAYVYDLGSVANTLRRIANLD